MTDANDLQDRKAAELLRSLENDETKVSQRRAEIFADVLAHYDKSLVADDPALPDILPDDSPSLRTERSGGHRWMLAAVVLLVAVGGIALLSRPDSIRLEATSEPDSEAVQMELRDGRFEVFSGRLSFEEIEGLTVSERTSEVALISNATDASSVADAIVLVDRGTRRIADRFTPLEAAGLISVGVESSHVNGLQIYRWAFTVTELGASELECTIGAPCFEIVDGVPETAIPSGTQAYVVEVLTSDGNRLLLMTNINGPLRAELAELLVSIEAG